MKEIIYIRLYAEVSSEESARKVAEEIQELTKEHIKLLEIHIEQYWKIPEYYEIVLRISPNTEASQIFHKLTSILGEGWEEQQPIVESIWNHGPNSSFVISSIKWAHIEVISKE